MHNWKLNANATKHSVEKEGSTARLKIPLCWRRSQKVMSDRHGMQRQWVGMKH